MRRYLSSGDLSGTPVQAPDEMQRVSVAEPIDGVEPHAVERHAAVPAATMARPDHAIAQPNGTNTEAPGQLSPRGASNRLLVLVG